MKLLAIDGNSILNRAFYGIKSLTTKNGEFTNGIYGFLSILLRLLDETQPDAVACAFDLRAPTFRHKLYEGYKSNRKGMPDELASQLAPLEDILGALGFKLVRLEGYEADDILGTFAKSCADSGNECVIATGDRDSLQLIGEHVSVRLATTKMGQPSSTLYDAAAVIEKYGVTPAELIEVKALMGDSSDCIPGVAGIGEKTALSLIAKYHSLDEIYAGLDTLEVTPGVRKKLADGKEMAYLSRTLGEICCEVPVETDPESYRRAPVDDARAAAMFARLEMFKLQSRWGIDSTAALAGNRAAGGSAAGLAANANVEPDGNPAVDAGSAGSRAGNGEASGSPAVDAGSAGSHAANGKPSGNPAVDAGSAGNGRGEAGENAGGGGAPSARSPSKPVTLVIEPADLQAQLTAAGSADLLAGFDGHGDPVAVAAALPGRLLLCPGENLAAALDSGAKLRVWSSKPLHKFAYKTSAYIQNVIFDGELAAYLLSPAGSSYELMQMAAQYGAQSCSLDDAAEIPERYETIARQALTLSELLDKLEAEIVANAQEKLLYEIEMPLARVLASMECEGFTLDTPSLAEYGVELDGRISELVNRIYELAGGELNLNSPKQLSELLFVKLGLPAKKKTKSGYSTNAEVLETLRGVHPIIELILEYRKLSKLKSTYVDGLLTQVGADGRVRSTFQQTETRTGRISSTEPNLQNIPVRTAEGSRMRRFFTARHGWKLIDADYSQIELRVLADIANDKNMIAAFKNGEDIHTATAAQVFRLPELMVTPLMRSRAKAVNFGIVYGIGAFSLSKDIGVTVSEADSYIKNYLETYSGVQKYMEKTIEFARKNGYVLTLFGRRRYLPELAASNKVTQAFGERVARNTPIQGTAADIIKIAMVRVFERLRHEKMEARLILQVHDELLVEAPESELTLATIILKEEMENAIHLKVPLEADTSVGGNWLDAKQ